MSDRIVSADEARRLLSEYDAGYLPDGPERYDLARTVVALHAEVARLRDDPALDGTDGAHPAWWRGHDRAAEVWQGRAEAAEREAAMLRGETAGAAVSLGIISDDLDSTRRQLDAARADLARVTAERDAAFARGAAAMRGAAVAYFARRAEASRREARESDTYKRFGSYSAAYDNADRDERIAETIRALIEAPAGESGGERE